MRAGWLVALLVLCVPSVAHADADTIAVRGSATDLGQVRAIGDFKPVRDPTLAAAVGAYGTPASKRSVGGGDGCKVAWPALGVRITFANFGVGSACAPEHGKAQHARVSGRQAWHTAKGLHIGDPLRKLRRLYPRASRRGRSFWLVTGVSPFGPRPARYPVLAAAVRDGAVRSFALEIGAAGD